MGEQEVVQITKQDQAQSYSNSTMCHTLSAAENLVYRICFENGYKEHITKLFEGYKSILGYNYQKPGLIFDAYDSFDGGKKKPIKDLLIQLIFLIENFKGDYSYYISKFGKYDFPKNLNGEQVIQIVSLYFRILQDIEKRFHQNEISKYYFNLIQVLQNKPSIDYAQDIYNLEADNPKRGKLNPHVVGQAYSKALQNQEEYVLNNAKTKNVQLYGQNPLKLDNLNDMNCNQDISGKGNHNEPKKVGNHASGATGNKRVKHQGKNRQNNYSEYF